MLLAIGLLLPRLLAAWAAAGLGRSASAILALGASVACAVALMGALHRVAPAAAGLGGLAYGGLLWVNSNAERVRFYNLSCLALSLGLVAATEGALRYTPAGIAWNGKGSRTRPDDIYGWVPEATDSFDLFEKAEHTVYPDRGYPVQIPAADGRQRLVAMGGSSTGGAFQNDDLADFYPARIAEGAGGQLQVINQGVGGWTTWHIRRYLLDHIDDLQPDVLTLYVGHNDLLTPVPVPYAQLYAAWRQGEGNRRLSRLLGQLRLYQALRYGLSALRPAARRVAVPIADARDNLVQITDAVVQRGGRVVLASEGLAPDPGPLAGYNAMMAELAEDRPGVSYLDVADLLHRSSGDPLFMDDCHLTEAGHRVVGEAFLKELRRQGLVQAGAAPLGPLPPGSPPP